MEETVRLWWKSVSHYHTLGLGRVRLNELCEVICG